MKYFELKSIVAYLSRFNQIGRVERIDDNIICIKFDYSHILGFDLSRGRGEIFDASFFESVRDYHAPFDLMLKKIFTRAKILGVTMPQNDRIIRIDTETKGAYKVQKNSLQLEFTGRHTNAIVLDEKGIVLEALRHIGSDVSFRIVKPGIKLKSLKPYKGNRKEGEIEDVENWLKERGKSRYANRIEQLKRGQRESLLKKIRRLDAELRRLPERRDLETEAKRFDDYGTIVLANLHKIKPYDTKLQTHDFEGNLVTIELPSLPNPGRIGEYFYTRAKRAANKAANIHIEEENLKSRIEFYRRLLESLEKAQSEEQIRLLFPPKQRHKKREPKLLCEVFMAGEFKVLLGRNERENIWVLKNARAGDIWLHLKNRPSSHCIIRAGGKKNIPMEVIRKAAKICVETSVSQPGDYLVDFTYRRNVKIERGAHVTYTKYDTLKVVKK